MDQMALLIAVFTQLFASNPQPVVTNAGTWNRQVFKKSGCRYFDFEVALGGGKKLRLRLVEQNINKEVTPGQLTYYAALARQGHKIAWLMDNNVPKGGDAYLGSIQDGEWVPKKMQGTQPAAKTTAVASQTVAREAVQQPEDPNLDLDMDAIPDINDDIPEWILTNYPDPEEVMDDYADFVQGIDQ